MRQSQSHPRLPAAWLLMTLAVLVALTAPSVVGHSVMLAALLFAGAAGYSLGHHEMPGLAHRRGRAPYAAPASQRADLERVYRSFEHVAVMPLTGALDRLRAPRQR